MSGAGQTLGRALVRPIIELAQPLLGPLGIVIPESALAQELDAALADFGRQILSTGGLLFAPLQSLVTDALTNFFAGASAFGSGLLQTIATAVGQALGNPQAITDAIVQAIQQNAGSLLTSIVPVIGATTGALDVHLTDVETRIVNTIQGALDSFTGGLTNFLQILERFFINELKQHIGDAAEYIINSLRGANAVISDLGNNITNDFNTLVNQINLNFSVFDNRLENMNDNIARVDNRVRRDLVTFHDSIVGEIRGRNTGLWREYQGDVIEPSARAGMSWFGSAGALMGQLIGDPCTGASALQTVFGTVFSQFSNWIQSIASGCKDNKNAGVCDKALDPFSMVTKSLSSIIGVGGSIGFSLAAGELVHPLKHLGLSRLAAYFWDMADFKAVGGSILGALNNVSTVIPLKYGLNEFFRPSLVDTRTADDWVFKEKMTPEEWHCVYARHGYPDTYIDRYYETMWTEPSDRMLIALMDQPGVSDAYIDKVVKSRGYDVLTQQLFKQYLVRKRLSDEFNTIKSGYESAVIKGYFSLDEYGDVLGQIGRSEIEIAWALYATNIKTEVARLTEDIDENIQAFRTGKFTVEEFSSEINRLSLVPAKAKNIIDKEIARRKTTAAAQTAAKQARVSLAQILAGYDLGLLDEAGALNRIIILDYTPDDANLLMQIHKAEIAEREATAEGKAQLAAAKASAKEEQQLAVDYAKYLIRAMQARMIQLDVVKVEIQALPLSDEYKLQLIRNAELANATDQDLTPDAAPGTLREIEIYKALNLGVITEAQAIAYLRVYGYSDEIIAIKLQVNKPLVYDPVTGTYHL